MSIMRTFSCISCISCFLVLCLLSGTLSYNITICWNLFLIPLQVYLVVRNEVGPDLDYWLVVTSDIYLTHTVVCMLYFTGNLEVQQKMYTPRPCWQLTCSRSLTICCFVVGCSREWSLQMITTGRLYTGYLSQMHPGSRAARNQSEKRREEKRVQVCEHACMNPCVTLHAAVLPGEGPWVLSAGH